MPDKPRKGKKIVGFIWHEWEFIPNEWDFIPNEVEFIPNELEFFHMKAWELISHELGI
jgi:hypothetical protein